MGAVCGSAALAFSFGPSLAVDAFMQLETSFMSDCTRAFENFSVMSPASRQKETSSLSCIVVAATADVCSEPPEIDWA